MAPPLEDISRNLRVRGADIFVSVFKNPVLTVGRLYEELQAVRPVRAGPRRAPLRFGVVERGRSSGSLLRHALRGTIVEKHLYLAAYVHNYFFRRSYPFQFSGGWYKVQGLACSLQCSMQ